MGTRVLSLWLPYLAIDRIRHDGPRPLPGQVNLPRATCREDEEGSPLVALCPRAERAGLRPGMTRAEAVSRVSNLLLHPFEPERDRAYLRACASWCERYTPFVAIDRSFPHDRGGALWLDIGSSAHLSGGEASLLARVLGRLRKEGVNARAAIADHPGSAWAACRHGSDEQRLLPPNGARVALAPWPVSALRLEKADCARLGNAGLDRVEHLYALPRRALAARFGDHVATRLDQALGLVDEPIAVDTPLPAQQAQMIFADPIIDPAALPPLVERLIHQLCIGLEAAGLGLRRLTLALYRVDNSTVTCSIGTDRPLRDVRRLAALIGDRFDRIDLGFGLERAILDAVEIEPILPETIRWRGLGSAADEALPDLACKDGNGSRAPADEPEPRRHRAWPDPSRNARPHPPLPPFLDAGPREAPLLPIPRSASAAALALSPAALEEPVIEETAPRPLRLLRQPEPIEAIASLPGEPPVLFRWRQHLHKVVGARGPETVAPDWWRQPEDEPRPPSRARDGHGRQNAPTRDYFAVEDSEGARFWLFREGRYDDPSTPLPRWFLHGVFA
ncbi:MAG: DNA polymerase Y family protein [Alphaproteobacteria bacterium]